MASVWTCRYFTIELNGLMKCDISNALLTLCVNNNRCRTQIYFTKRLKHSQLYTPSSSIM